MATTRRGRSARGRTWRTSYAWTAAGGSAPGSYRHDAVGRLVYGTGTDVRFDYDGSEIATELNGAGTILRRYVSGPGADEPLVWYEGTGTGSRRFLDADERGSVIRVTNFSGGQYVTNTYDEFGRPGSGNAGRFQYTGQAWLPELGLYYYKARLYAPTLGRFTGPDPIGMANGPNIYNYVGGDPVNNADPSGMQDETAFPETVVTAPRVPHPQNGSTVSFRPTALQFDQDRTIQQIKGLPEDDTNVTTVVGRRIRLPNLRPVTLYLHYLDGSGDPVCLTSAQFSSLLLAGKRVGSPAPRAGGGYAQQFDLYNTPYANSFGTATLLIDVSGNATGFSDFYDFDAHARSTLKAQVMTGIGGVGGLLAGGRSYSVDYNSGVCRQ